MYEDLKFVYFDQFKAFAANAAISMGAVVTLQYKTYDTWIKGKEKVKPRGRLVPSSWCASMKVWRHVAM